MDRLRHEIERYDTDRPVDRASTPPSSWYVDKDIFTLEHKAVFATSWLVAGRADLVREPGTFLAGQAGGEPYVITRDTQGKLHAFYNVCRHHAALVATGSGCAEMLPCPYHGWCYGLDGDTLRGRIGKEALYAWLYPNFMINRYHPAMDTNLVIPLGPRRTRVEFDFYFEKADGPEMDAFVKRSLASTDTTQAEDMDICESVQRGLESSAYDQGRLAPALELGEHHFHCLLAGDLRRGLDA